MSAEWHANLRPHVDSAEELYALLLRMQELALCQVGGRMLLCIAFLTVGLVDPGTLGKVALCFAVPAGMACVWSIADHVARDSLMHLITLQDLIGPRYESADLLMPDWRSEFDEVTEHGE